MPGRDPAAEAALRRAVELDSNDIEALNWLANALDKQTAANEKLQLYTKIVEIEPLWWPAVFNKLNLLFDTGNMQAAERSAAGQALQGRREDT